ncbi:CHAD domain-containing protein [Plantactinospora sp. GCM10030261]|uniref:CYTH and CHAD domain-containing protein n=1 Tax=Plantactinospora sp. GCM10030261 TaxID=3273420 RepID=UPI00360BEF24
MVPIVERERKYAGPDGFVVPDLAGCGPVATVAEPVRHELVADYLDTADLRLTRGGFSLRRRTGGDDAGWHLKIGRPGGDRMEHRFPAGPDDTDPPAELRSLIRGATRGRRVRPVARIETSRTEHPLRDADGRVLAVLAEDAVRGHDLARDRRHSWHEIEVELVDGDDRLLAEIDTALRNSGARPLGGSKVRTVLADRLAETTASTAVPPTVADVVDYARTQRDALILADPAARQGDEGAVHGMRVASRRLRSTLRTFRGLWDRDTVESLRGELKWLADGLAPVRDAHVMSARLLAAVRAEPRELVIGPVAARIQQRFDADVARAVPKLRRLLQSSRYVTLLNRLDELLDAPPPHPVRRRWVDSRIRKSLRRADGMLDAAIDSLPPPADQSTGGPGGADGSDAAFHEARKAYKRARYAIEVRRASRGPEIRELRKRLKELQDLLGGHQDAAITREVLRRYAMRAFRDGENTFTYGLLHARQAAAADQLLRAVPSARDEVRRRRVRRWLER